MEFKICDNLEQFSKNYFLEKLENKGINLSKVLENYIIELVEKLKENDLLNIEVCFLNELSNNFITFKNKDNGIIYCINEFSLLLSGYFQELSKQENIIIKHLKGEFRGSD